MGTSFSAEATGHRDDTVRSLQWIADALEDQRPDGGRSGESEATTTLSKKPAPRSHAHQHHHTPVTGGGAITHLCLPAQGIDDLAAARHASTLARCADLATLDLSYNDLTAAGVAAVVAMGVAPLVAQQALEFSEAAAVGAAWLERATKGEQKSLAENIPSPHLPTLLSVFRLSGNPFGSAAAATSTSSNRALKPPSPGTSEAVVAPVVFETATAPLPVGVTSAGVAALCQLLAHDQGLEQLVLYNCALTDADVLAVVNASLLHPRLHTLNLGANPALSTRSVLVLAEFARRCNTLRSVVVGSGLVIDVDVAEPIISGADGDGVAAPTASHHHVVQNQAPPALVSAAASLHDALLANRVRYTAEMRRRADADARRAARMVAAAERRDAAAREAAAARAAIDAELAALQREKDEQERAIGEIRAVLNAKAATEAESRRQRTQAQQDDIVRQAVADAYEWRERLTAGGNYEREYRAGFTTLRMVHSTDPVTGRPTDHLEPVDGPPRRLRPCTAEGCELHGKLHYHCRHEGEGAALQLRQLHKSQTKARAAAAAAGVPMAIADRPPPYVGCRATGHICATVGFYAPPLPDTTAAHFFASPHPTTASV